MVDALNAPSLLGRQVWTVAALVHAVADALAARFAVCTVRGEISSWSRAASGHCYFSLKDVDGGDALLRCAMFRRAAGLLDFAPRNGQLVTLRGRLAVYEPRGELQFIVEAMQPAGEGALFEQFLRLKAKLEAEGLFDPARKRPLPRFARRVGIVSSLGGAALHDVVSSFRRRAPHVELVVYPSPVQGSEAPAALIAALQQAEQRNEIDLLLLCRGGGSLEDLWAFNDERLVRAVAACTLPVICGVGHETDVSLCDFAADLRAPTPTAAAELAVPATSDCLLALDGLAGRSRRRLQQLLDGHAQRLDRLSLRLTRPSDAVHRQSRRLDALASRLAGSGQRLIDAQRQRSERQFERLRVAIGTDLAAHDQRLQRLAGGLGALDPARVLSRGYAWISDRDGKAVTSVASLAAGDELAAVLHDGKAKVQVTSTEPGAPPH
ncbi:exodeoxyribonuclease VII large subunit [Piscinibacter sakaiensis]|uniref:exodeoxyribonuclease VII large subunit n=1 Tax=Piscinibacter sakaiensis TaxID=1547922 RepID=UPI003AB105F3